MGVVSATDLIKVARPIQDKHLLFQPFTQAATLSLMKAKSLERFDERNKGKPRYLESLAS